MPDTLHIIANPNAAGGKGRRALTPLRRLLEAKGAPFLLELTEARGHAADLARRAAERGVHRILVVGGDGTLHEVVNGLLEWNDRDPGPAVAVCPVGTGNDFHRMVRTASGPEAALEAALHGRPRRFDVGRVSWNGGREHFVNLLGLGIDVEVLRRRVRFRRLPGLSQYLAALASAAVRYRHREIAVDFEGANGDRRRLEARSLLAAVTVGPSVGGGFLLSPGATPDDGLLDLFLVEDLGLLGIARHLPRVLRGTHGRVPEIHMHRFRRAWIQARDGAPFHFELDGELMPAPARRLDVEVLPGRLRVLEAPVGGEESR